METPDTNHLSPEYLSLIDLLSRIRAAVGDPTGKLMQASLVAHCQKMREALEGLAQPVTRSDYTVADLDRIVREIASKALTLDLDAKPALPAGVWVRTVDEPPCPVGEQAILLMWSPGWAAWLQGMVTRFEDQMDWALYDSVNDKFVDWTHVPEFYCLVETPDSFL
jgi:hypothetical protein